MTFTARLSKARLPRRRDMTISVTYTFHDATVVITGAGSGIGAALSRHCARAGATVIAVDVNHKTLLRDLEAELEDLRPVTGEQHPPKPPPGLNALIRRIAETRESLQACAESLRMRNWSVTGETFVGSLEIDAVAMRVDGREVVVTSIESFHKERAEARAGENVGLLLRGVKRDEVVRGQVVSAVGAIGTHEVGEAEIFLLSAKEGGRHTPLMSGYKPQFFFGATDVTGTLVVDGSGTITPGNRAHVTFALQKPVAIESGMRFALREGGRTVGAGIVTKVQ
jgi:hypothetical protein